MDLSGKIKQLSEQFFEEIVAFDDLRTNFEHEPCRVLQIQIVVLERR